MIKVALIGNPNVGKSTLFNSITGLNQHTGNWPGKTIAISWSDIEYAGFTVRLVDLPGTYSLEGEDGAEKVVEEYLETNPDKVVVVADASCLHKSLYIFVQVMELGLPTLLVINMMDEAKKLGIHIDFEGLKNELKIPVIGTSASTGDGVNDLLKVLAKETPSNKFKKRSPEKRHAFVDALVKKYVRGSSRRKNSLDFLLFNPFFDLTLIFLTFLVLLGPTFWVASLASKFFAAFTVKLGLLGSILDAFATFIPLIFSFYVVFTALEDSGLLGRVAASVDKYMPFPGKSFFPLAISFGCNVMGIPATRIIKDEKYKFSTAMAVSFIPCSTRISVLLLFLSFFPPLTAMLLMLAIMFLMLALVLLTAWIFSGFAKKEPLLLELPPIRKPSLKTIINLSLLRTGTFIKKIAAWVALGAVLGAIFTNYIFDGLALKTAYVLALGFVAKELTLGAMASIFGTTNLLTVFSFKVALAFLFFYAFYTPCLSTVAAMKAEFGTKRAILSIVWSLFVSGLLASIVLLLL